MEHIDSNTLWNYVTGSVSKSEETQVQEHLTSCKACMGEFEILSKIEVTLHEINEDTVPFDFSDRVIKEIEKELAHNRKYKFYATIFPYAILGGFVLAFIAIIIKGVGLELEFSQLGTIMDNQVGILVLIGSAVLWGLYLIDRICRRFFVPVKYA